MHMNFLSGYLFIWNKLAESKGIIWAIFKTVDADTYSVDATDFDFNLYLDSLGYL